MKGLTSKQMSKIYWKQRKRGKPHNISFSVTGIAKKISKKGVKKGKQSWIKKKHPFLDFDGDGVINKFDCQPFNKFKQDLYDFKSLMTNEMKAKSASKSDNKLARDIKKEPISTKAMDKEFRKGVLIRNVKRKEKRKSITQKEEENYGWLTKEEAEEHISNRQAGKQIEKATMAGMKIERGGFISPENKLDYRIPIKKSSNKSTLKEKLNKIKTTKINKSTPLRKISKRTWAIMMKEEMNKLSGMYYQTTDLFQKSAQNVDKRLREKGFTYIKE